MSAPEGRPGETPSDNAGIGFHPDPDDPDWMLRPGGASGAFVDIFGAMRVRREAGDRARVRFETGPQHQNLVGTVHGGYLLAVVDQALFIAPAALGIAGAIGGVTVDASAQFLAPAALDAPLDAVVEVLRETGRLIFMRGLIVQGETKLLAFSGTIRKASRR